MTTTRDDIQPLSAPSALPPWQLWSALLAMMLTSFSLTSAEFLPGGILTLVSADLGVSEGAAGQMVTATAGIGFFAALSVGALTPGIDRRTVLVVMAVLGAISNLGVAMAPSYPLLLASRFLLGAALSGFWAMSLTVAARVAGPERVATSMTLVTAGTALSTVAGVPLGVLFSAEFGWRAVFFGAAIITAIAAIALRILLPTVPPEPGASLAALVSTARRPGVTAGLLGHISLVVGLLVAYTYVRVALERVPDIDTAGIATLLLVFGVGGLVGNIVIGVIAARFLTVLRYAVPGTNAAAIATIALWPDNRGVVTVAIALWGAAFSSWLVVRRRQ